MFLPSYSNDRVKSIRASVSETISACFVKDASQTRLSIRGSFWRGLHRVERDDPIPLRISARIEQFSLEQFVQIRANSSAPQPKKKKKKRTQSSAAALSALWCGMSLSSCPSHVTKAPYFVEKIRLVVLVSEAEKQATGKHAFCFAFVSFQCAKLTNICNY